MRKIMPVLLLLLFLITSCKRTIEAPPITKENISGTWQLTAKRMSATGVPEQDAFLTMAECEKDDLYIFRPDHVFIYQDTGAMCEFNGSSYTLWEINEKVITFMGQTGCVTNFHGSSMEVTVEVRDSNTESIVSIKYTFKRV